MVYLVWGSDFRDYATWLAIKWMGQMKGSPVRPRPMTLPQMAFLHGESEHHESGLGQEVIISVACGWCKDSAVVTYTESDVLELERNVVASGSRVFTRPAQRGKGNAKHVDDGQGFCGAMLPCDVHYLIADHANQDWFDYVGWRVGLSVASQLAAKLTFHAAPIG
jgi:hypothetical protein